MIITKHAMQRIRKRVGVTVKGAERIATRALENGITHNDTNGTLNHYMSRQFLKYRTANNLRIWCNFVYVFCNDTLVTVFQLPPELRKYAEKIRKRKKAKARI